MLKNANNTGNRYFLIMDIMFCLVLIVISAKIVVFFAKKRKTQAKNNIVCLSFCILLHKLYLC